MDTETQVYRELQKYLDRMPGGFAATESDMDIRVLKHLFTPEEARVAMQLSMKPEPIKRIYSRVQESGMTLEELQQVLDTMVRKGTAVPKVEGYDEKHYKGGGFTAGGIFSVQVGRLTRDLIDDHQKYQQEIHGAQKAGTRMIPPLRTIPVEKSIPVPEKYHVSDYDSVRKLVENAPGPIAVADCICRQITEILGGHCTKTDLMETCLIVGPDHARHYVDMGIGRFISKEETLDILNKVQEAGLILQPENSLKPEAICVCCGDCCAMLKIVKNYPRPADLYLSNYYSAVDPKLCTGCQECIEKCQLEALVMVDSVAEVNLDRCIGCGNCVVICPSDAIQLKQKEEVAVPFKDKEAYNMQLLSDRAGKWNTFKVRAKMLLGLKV